MSLRPSGPAVPLPAANRAADGRRQAEEPLEQQLISTRERADRAAFLPTVALTTVAAIAAVAVLLSLVMLAVEPKPIPGLELSQRQDAETAVYLAAFGLVLPLALVGAPRLADRIARGPNAAALSPLTALLVTGLAAAAVLTRLSESEWGDGVGMLLAAAGLWWFAAGAAVLRAARPRPWNSVLRLAGLAPGLWVAAGLAVLGALLTVTHLDSISPLPLALGAAVVAAVVLLLERYPIPRLGARWGLAGDALLVAVLLLTVVDLVTVRPEDSGSSFLGAYQNQVIQFHHDFLLGPANQVLGGGAMLVETASQYGVGSILFLAGWFELAPIGYGTFAFLDGLLTALFFVAGYLLVRMAGGSRMLAAAAVAVAIVALVFNRLYPVGALPQEGPLRFGLAMALIVATVAGARWPRHSRAAQATALGVLAVSSIWSLEALALAAFTFAAMALFRAYLLPAERLKWLVRQAGLAAGACASAQLLFALATLAGAGQLPDWGQYIAYLHAFLFRDLGDITYDFSRWSPGLAVGALYIGSAAALVLLLRRRPDLARAERPVLLALAGTTAYGTLLFYYYVDRSGDHILPYVCLPAVLTGALWLSLVVRSRAGLPRGVVKGVLAFALSVAVLLLAVAWSSVDSRFERSALAHVTPGGQSTRAALDRLWNFPPVDGRVPDAERLLERYMPGEPRTLVLITPSRTTETLMRSGRSNRLPLAQPVEDGFVSDERKPLLLDAVSALSAGDRLLVDEAQLEALARVNANPASKLLEELPPDAATAPLQVFTLREIDQRFRLQPIHRDRQGFTVVELAPRR